MLGALFLDYFLIRLLPITRLMICFSYAVPILTTEIVHRWIIKPILERNRRIAWSSHGFCPQCGYDLRATPERCPECGAVPVKLLKA
jgi:hypothetical protein